MEIQRATYFPDTNVFLQCRAIQELPWEALTSASEILLLIAVPVQREIDRLKGDGRGRRAKRARKASQLFRSVVSAPDGQLLIRESSPRVILSFPPPITSVRPLFPDLDLSYADDHLVADVLIYSVNNGGERVVLLTNDTGPLLAARRHDLEFTVVPDEWLLEPEPDYNERKIADLTRRLEHLESGGPRIEVSCLAQDEREIDSLELEVTSLRAFTSGEVDELIAQATRMHPMQTDFTGNYNQEAKKIGSALGFAHQRRPPSQHEIERYQNDKYPAWIESLREFFVELPQLLEQAGRRSFVQFRVANVGTQPGEHTTVELRTHGDILLQAPPKKDSDESLRADKIPAPPTPPSGRIVRSSIFGDLYPTASAELISQQYRPFLDIPESRDRYAFYWNGRGSDPTTEWHCECEEFRHQTPPELFECPLYIPRDRPTGGGLIECVVHAANLPLPARRKIPVKMNYCESDAIGRARKLLRPPPLANVFGSAD